MLIYHVVSLARALSIAPPENWNDACSKHGYRVRSNADWLIDQMEQKLRINDTSGSLRERTERIEMHLGKWGE